MNTFTQSFFAILLFCILPASALKAQNVAPYVTADGNQVYCPGTPMPIVTDFNITDPDDSSTDNIYIQISAGYVNGQDLLSLPAGHPTISASWNAATGKLTLHGVGGSASYADFISAVEDVMYTSNNANATGTRNFSITVGAANYLPSTGHYYMFVPLLGITWTNAKTAAAASTYFGLQGYLATLTTQEEALLCGLQASGNGWIGGSDAAVEGVWRWETGPEAGTIFWNGGPAGSSPTYAFWNTGEPNNQNNEDYAHITAPGIGVPGSWNDLSITGDTTGAYAAQGYVVEYGGMPGDPVLNISASTTISFAKITSNTPASRCGGGTVTLAAVASYSMPVYWYTSATGGTPLATGTSFTTPVITSSTTYYATAYEGNCATVPRTPVTATISALPTITTTAPSVSVCQGSTAVVQATPSAGTVRWYTVATGGTSVGTGTSFTTPAITSTTSYFAEAVSSSTGCVSATRVEITVTPSPQPTVAVTAPAPLCGQGSATIQATPSAGVVNWYAAATGGTILATGTSYTTPVITATTTYYAEAVNGTCVSAARQPATVTVNALPVINSASPASICAGQTATISVGTSTPATINWYDSLTGGTLLGTGNSFTTPVLTTTASYYAEAVNAQGCTSDVRASTQVTVNALPTLTVTTPVTTCAGSPANLTATPSAGAVINWYTTATGGALVGTGSNFTTPAITANTIYYAEAVSATCTSAARSAVTVNVSTLPTLTVTTPAPLCGQGSTTIQATPSVGVVNWYATATGGTVLATGTTYTTPVISTTTTYYAEAANGSCISARQPVTVTVNALPTINSASPVTVCAGQAATIAVSTQTPATINWYNAATGGTLLGTGNSYTTPVLNASKTYYAEAVSPEGCTSAVRTSILVTVTPLPTLTVTTPVTTCTGSTATLQAAPSAGATITWYTTATGGTSVGTGNNFTTPAINASTTYYAEAANGTCISTTRKAVSVTISASPTVTVTTPPTLCGPGTATLQATPSAGTVNWYTTATGGTPIGTGNTITSPVVTATTTFYAEAVSVCTSLIRQPLTVTVNALPTVTSTTNGVICETGRTTISAVPSSGTINWYATATGGPVLSTGQSFTTPVLTATTTYYAEVVSPGGCVSAARTPIEATVVPLPTLTVTATVDVCGPVRATLQGIPSDGTINWYDAPTGGHLVGIGNSIQSPVITGDRTFYAEAVNNGCSSATREAVTVFYHPLPAVGGDERVLFCEGGDVDLDAGVTGMTYVWSTAETSQIITVTTAGVYSVVVTTPDGCTATKEFTVSMLTAPVISTVSVKSDDALVIMVNNDPENYEYSIDGGPYQNSPQFNNLLNGYHTVSAVSTNGCGEDDYTFLVFVVPKFFTPNGDTINDEFTLGGINQFPELTVDIFDRYGKLITVLNRRNRGWDGTFNGYRLPATDYWYVIKLDNSIPEIKGHFSLLR
ncbi:T9SS type B sorting domain-containing protein [Flavobacterium sp. DGU11]|uniref:T9SS type B sorting domain-containing protein n=1 Tax=Flavobacterium arundinis TaxID=3139143 RepID=A0ABU9HTY3_9FLAO